MQNVLKHIACSEMTKQNTRQWQLYKTAMNHRLILITDTTLEQTEALHINKK